MEAIGYDGKSIKLGDRVELHPGCDLWMRGAKYGAVTGIAKRDGAVLVYVRLDLRKDKPSRAFAQDRVRWVRP